MIQPVPLDPALRARAPREDEEPSSRGMWTRLSWLFEMIGDDLIVIAAVSISAFVRAMGLTVRTGQTGLRFSLGRAGSELEPGFHLMVPFLQRGRVMPTRSRTLDLPSQRVATAEGLVYHADANLVYRVVDVRKAMIEIDDLVKGMQQMLGLGVQEVLRRKDRRSIQDTEYLNEQLARNLAARLEPWGVVVERAGFPSISPSPQSLRITQLVEVTEERRRALDLLEGAPGSDLARALALGLVGTRQMPRTRTRAIRAFESHRRRLRKLRTELRRRGWNPVRIRRAELALMSRVSTSGRMRALTR